MTVLVIVLIVLVAFLALLLGAAAMRIAQLNEALGERREWP